MQLAGHGSFLAALIVKVHLSLADRVELAVEVALFAVFVNLAAQTSRGLLREAFVFEELALFFNQIFFFLRTASFFLAFSQVFGLDLHCEVQVVHSLEGLWVSDVSSNFAVHLFVFL